MTSEPVPGAVASERAAEASSGQRSRIATTTLLTVAALAFALPFGTVSCDGETVSFTGVELATFSVDPDPTQPRGTLAADVEGGGSVVALIALACALGGALSAGTRARGGGFAIVGSLALVALPSNAGLAEVEIHAGYVLALGALVAAGVWRGAARLVDRRHRGQRIWPYLVAAVPAGLGALVAAIVVAGAIAGLSSG